MPDARDLAPRPRVNRVLGATSGPFDGNVTAILALVLVIAFLGLLGYASVEYIHNGREVAHDFVVGGFGALLAGFSAVIGLYIGNRTANGGS